MSPPDLDTWLAWALLRQGRLPREVLRDLLAEARQRRGAGGPTLAQTLVTRGLVSAQEVDELVRLAAPRGHAPPRRRLGDYELMEELGAGGMGRVHVARHAVTGARYALKTFAAVDRELLERFQREGQGLARVDDHPSIVKVHSLGRDGATWFLVMDLVEGGSLAERLRGGPPPPEVAGRWVRDLALAVEHAHARGVLHRDLKPENVLFDGERPKLVDFGLAKLVDARSLTATGTILGTPSYMAPEQVDGARGPVGVAADVYGLGAVLYACLTGRPPFGGGSTMATLLQVLEEPPAPPRRLRPEVPPALEAVCLRALEKDPARRFPSALALARAVEEALEAGAEGGRPRGRRAGVVAGLAAAVGVVAAAVVRAWPEGDGQASAVAPPTRTERVEPEPPPPPGRTERAPVAVDAPTRPPAVWRMRPVWDLEPRFRASMASITSLEALLAAPPSSEHGRILHELARLHDENDDDERTLECLARATLLGDCDAALVLGLSALPEPRPGGVMLKMPELGAALTDAVGEDAAGFAVACFVLAAYEVKPDGTIEPRAGRHGNEQLDDLFAATKRPRPTYEDAYRRVWLTFPGARPSAVVPAGPPGAYFERRADVEEAYTKAKGPVDAPWEQRGTDGPPRWEMAKSGLLRVVAMPPSIGHRRAYRQLAYAYDRLNDGQRAVECLARAALLGDGEAAVVLAAKTLDPSEQYVEVRFGWRFDPATTFSKVRAQGPRDRALRLALFTLALNEPQPGGAAVSRAENGEGYLGWARRWVEEHVPGGDGALPAYPEAYRVVCEAFPTARPW